MIFFPGLKSVMISKIRGVMILGLLFFKWPMDPIGFFKVIIPDCPPLCYEFVPHFSSKTSKDWSMKTRKKSSRKWIAFIFFRKAVRNKIKKNVHFCIRKLVYYFSRFDVSLKKRWMIHPILLYKLFSLYIGDSPDKESHLNFTIMSFQCTVDFLILMRIGQHFLTARQCSSETDS